MKAATGSKTKQRIAIVLGIIALLTVTRSFWPSGGGEPEPATVATSAAKGTAGAGEESLDPRLHLDLLAKQREAEKEAEEERKASIPPPPPPINLKFFGFSSRKGEAPKAFLSQGDNIWIAHEGDVVDRHYKIVHITPSAVDVEDLLNSNRQTIQLTQV